MIKHLFPSDRSKPQRRKPSGKAKQGRKRNVINRLIERDMIHKISYDEYSNKVRSIYDGPKGAMLKTFSALSGHEQLGERLIRERRFDVSDARQLLDVGSGAGQIMRHLLKFSHPSANIVGFDLSAAMLRRARQRIKTDRPALLATNVLHLPFRDEVFDCVTCGYVLEHLPDANAGLAELCRVMQPGGRMLLFATEDNLGGAWTSRMWGCRTYNREELLAGAASVGLHLTKELWFTKMHKVLRAGGICVELQKQ
ncbi:MAG: class I SAM-dependent methyltransferase [Pirellulales bacterium]